MSVANPVALVRAIRAFAAKQKPVFEGN